MPDIKSKESEKILDNGINATYLQIESLMKRPLEDHEKLIINLSFMNGMDAGLGLGKEILIKQFMIGDK